MDEIKKSLAETAVMMSQQVVKLGQALTTFAEDGYPPPELKDLFLSVEALAKRGAAEVGKIQLESKATPGRC